MHAENRGKLTLPNATEPQESHALQARLEQEVAQRALETPVQQQMDCQYRELCDMSDLIVTLYQLLAPVLGPAEGPEPMPMFGPNNADVVRLQANGASPLVLNMTAMNSSLTLANEHLRTISRRLQV